MVSETVTLPLERIDPEQAGLDPGRMAKLCALVQRHVDAGRYLGAQMAMARDGRLALFRSFGRARAEPEAPVSDETMFLLFSQTKPIVAATVWTLVERGLCRFADRIAEHIPGFERHGKGAITLFDVMTHQCGFPNANVPDEAWADHELLRRSVCDFTLEWTPGERVQYHGGSAHWVLAVLIEALTGQDYRQVVREVICEPLALRNLFVGVPAAEHGRLAHIHRLEEDRHVSVAERNRPAFYEAGVPGGGGYAGAADLAAFYQMLCHGGALNGVRILSPRMVQFVTRNWTADRIDHNMGMPMHRGLGVHVRGYTPTIRGLGTIASPATFGHGGAGTSYSWADPETGVSFSYLTNTSMPEPDHTARLDIVSSMAHACIERL